MRTLLYLGGEAGVPEAPWLLTFRPVTLQGLVTWRRRGVSQGRDLSHLAALRLVVDAAHCGSDTNISGYLLFTLKIESATQCEFVSANAQKYYLFLMPKAKLFTNYTSTVTKTLQYITTGPYFLQVCCHNFQGSFRLEIWLFTHSSITLQYYEGKKIISLYLTSSL